jgi:hypothetical protein
MQKIGTKQRHILLMGGILVQYLGCDWRAFLRAVEVGCLALEDLGLSSKIGKTH